MTGIICDRCGLDNSKTSSLSFWKLHLFSGKNLDISQDIDLCEDCGMTLRADIIKYCETGLNFPPVGEKK